MLVKYNRKFIRCMPKLYYPPKKDFVNNVVEEIIDVPKPESPKQPKSTKRVKPALPVAENTVVEE